MSTHLRHILHFCASNTIHLQSPTLHQLALKVIMSISSYIQISRNFHSWFLPGGKNLKTYFHNPIRDVPFLRVSFFSINSWTGYENWSETSDDYLFKNNRLLFSLLFLNFLLSNNSETGYRSAIFFLNGLWKFLKNGYLPVKLHLSAPGGSSSA